MKRTSLTHPLQIAAVDAGPEFGRVGITFCPGKYDPHAMSGAWDRDLATDDYGVALGKSLAGDPALRILPKTSVKHGIGDGVANFIRMTLTDGFGSKNETTKHMKKGSGFRRGQAVGT